MLRDGDIDLVKESVNMTMIANYYGLRVNRVGYALCPFHDDKHPSMQVFSGFTSKDGFYCRSCGAGGNIFNFVMQYENLTFEETVRKIAAIFKVPIIGAGELSPDDIDRVTSNRMKQMLSKEYEQAEFHQMLSLTDTIRLYKGVMSQAKPYSHLFCDIGTAIPILQGEWDERYQKYCNRR